MSKSKRSLEDKTIEGGIPFSVTVIGRDKRPSWKRMYQNPNLGNTEQYYNRNILKPIIELIPGIGDAVDAVEVAKHVRDKEYANAGILAAGLALPNIIEKPLRIGKRLGKFITNRITKQGLRNIAASAGDAAIHTGIGGGGGYIIGDYFGDKIGEDDIKYHTANLGLLGGGAFGLKHRFSPLTHNAVINDILTRPVETAIEASKGKYPFTKKQEKKLVETYKDKVTQAIKEQGDVNEKIDVRFLKDDKHQKGILGSYTPGFVGEYIHDNPVIKLNTYIAPYSRIPITYTKPFGDIKSVAAHEFRHHIQDTNPALKHSRLLDENQVKTYNHGIDEARYNPTFEPLRKNQGYWDGSPDEVDSELSFVQDAFSLSPYDMPNDKGVAFISDRFGVSYKNAKDMLEYFINNRKANPRKMSSGGSIHIAPSKRGTFTAAAKRHGMGVQEFASQVLGNKDNYSPAMVKKANFARNASKWKH